MPRTDNGNSNRDMPTTGRSEPEQAKCCNEGDELAEAQSRTSNSGPSHVMPLSNGSSPSCTQLRASKGSPGQALPCNGRGDSRLATSKTGDGRSTQHEPRGDGNEPVFTRPAADGTTSVRDAPLGGRVDPGDAASRTSEKKSGRAEPCKNRKGPEEVRPSTGVAEPDRAVDNADIGASTHARLLENGELPRPAECGAKGDDPGRAQLFKGSSGLSCTSSNTDKAGPHRLQP